MAHAMIYATARLRPCEPVTADADLRGLSGVVLFEADVWHTRPDGTLRRQARWPRWGRVACLFAAREAPRRGKSGHRRAGRWLNGQPGKPEGKRNREQTASGPFRGVRVRVKR